MLVAFFNVLKSVDAGFHRREIGFLREGETTAGATISRRAR